MINNLKKREIHGGQVVKTEDGGHRLIIPQTTDKTYKLAQLDDYMHLPRIKFPHQPDLTIQVDARIIGDDIKGTFGFGLWNDPFSFGFGPAGISKFLPVLPNVAWFFYASEPNYLSLGDNKPAVCFYAQTFKSLLIPSFISVLGAPVLPFLFFRPSARCIRKLLRSVINEKIEEIDIEIRDWHTYGLSWQDEMVVFEVDQKELLKTTLSPRGKLGLVIWIDNQYFRFDPGGHFSMGNLATSAEQVMEIRNLEISP